MNFKSLGDAYIFEMRFANASDGLVKKEYVRSVPRGRGEDLSV